MLSPLLRQKRRKKQGGGGLKNAPLGGRALVRKKPDPKIRGGKAPGTAIENFHENLETFMKLFRGSVPPLVTIAQNGAS